MDGLFHNTSSAVEKEIWRLAADIDCDNWSGALCLTNNSWAFCLTDVANINTSSYQDLASAFLGISHHMWRKAGDLNYPEYVFY